MPPITLAYLAAALEVAGIDVEFYDDVLHRGDEASLRARLHECKPDIVGISVVTGTVGGAERASRIVRSASPESTIVTGNIHAGLFHEDFLKSGIADVVVHDEGEVTLVELVRELAVAQPDLSKVDGIVEEAVR